MDLVYVFIDVNVNDWEANTIYKGVYNNNHKVI